MYCLKKEKSLLINAVKMCDKDKLLFQQICINALWRAHILCNQMCPMNQHSQ